MRMLLPISYKNEPELVALYHELGSRSFSVMIKDALHHIVRPNYVGKITIPETLLLETPETNIKYTVGLSISSEKDNDIEGLLLAIKPGMRTKFIKQCVKLYIGVKGLQAYFNKDYSDKLLNLSQSRVPQIVYQLNEYTPKKVTVKKERKVTTKKRTFIPQPKVIEPLPVKPVFNQEVYEEKNTITDVDIDTDVSTDTNSDTDDVLAMLESLLS